MSLLSKTSKRNSLVVLSKLQPRDIAQEYGKPAKLLIGEQYIMSACMGCSDQPCMRFTEDEISCSEFPDFSYERNYAVCPVKAIQWDFTNEMPVIQTEACLGCGLCAARCPMGAIYFRDEHVCVSHRSNNQFMQMVPYTAANIKRQQEQLETIKRIAWQHRFRRESTQVMKDLYDKLQGVDGRSMIPNLLARNLLICLGYKCAISRIGDVYTRMDAVYAGRAEWDKTIGVIEVEFGRDTLDASRGILDDIAVLHSRSHINKNTNSALVVCLSFPNRRQGYFQVIKDIKNVLDLEIQTISLGALLLFVWNSSIINLGKREFYTDFDNMSIQVAVENRLGRKVLFPAKFLGILEPEK